MRVERAGQLGVERQLNVAGHRPANVRDDDADHVVVHLEVDDHEWPCLRLSEAPRLPHLPPRNHGGDGEHEKLRGQDSDAADVGPRWRHIEHLAQARLLWLRRCLAHFG
jgi:hypothetical protein